MHRCKESVDLIILMKKYNQVTCRENQHFKAALEILAER